jgi:antagonist of KipI
MIEVLQPGLVTTIQDKGRKGYEAYGIPPSGVFDPFLAAIANRLVENGPDSAVLEFALLGPSLKFHHDAAVAITGSGCRFLLNGEPVSEFRGFRISAGAILQFKSMVGWFGYLAVGGGIEGKRILGSMSAYVTGHIGKRLRAGDLLDAGKHDGGLFAIDRASVPLAQKIPLVSGLHTHLFSQADKNKIAEMEYRITAQSNRMGLRLAGVPLDPPVIRRSCPVVSGAVQVPQSGQPIILGPDGPTTGGYAQIGVIARAGWTTLAATPPGRTIEFQWTDREDALRIWRERNVYLQTERSWEKVE